MPDYGDVDPITGETNTRSQTGGTVDPYAPSVANGQISPEQWAAYQKKRKRDAILGMLATLGGTAALGAAGNVLGGAGAASPSASATGALPAIEGGAPWAVTPYASAASMNAPGAIGAGAAAAASGAASGASANTGSAVGAGMTARDWAALGTGLVGAAGGAITANNQNTGPSTATTDPAFANLINYQTRRLQAQEPLSDAVLQLAMSLLPTRVQRPFGQGTSGPSLNPNSASDRRPEDFS